MTNNIKNNILKQGIFLMCACILLLLNACDFEYPLPDAGSIADETPPSAAFSYSVVDTNHLNYSFSNESGSATDFIWDFGDGNTSMEANPSHIYSTEGEYTVTLTSTDKLNVTDEVTQSFTIYPPNYCVELDAFIDDPCDDGDPVTSDDKISAACVCGGEDPKIIPEILEAGFEDNSLPDGTGDGRDSWRNDAGGVIQITESPVFKGTQAAKLPSAGDRVGMQEIEVSPNNDYKLTFYYTMKADPGTLTVAILSNKVASLGQVADATIASVALTDNSDPNTYVMAELEFNTGDNEKISILFHNEGSECRLDDFKIL